MNVKLPNGQVISNVPEGTTQAEVMRRAIAGGLATEEDFGIAPAPAPAQSSFLENLANQYAPGLLEGAERAGQAIQQSVPEPSTIGGIGGSVIGTMIGGVPGGMLGGALGSSGGELIERAMQPGEMTTEDYVAAGKEGLISLGIDAATLGVGKAVAPGFRKLFEMYQKTGKTPQQAATEIAELGTDEALKRTQKFLSDRGATLTPAQFGDSSKYETIKESIGRAGILSGRRYNENVKAINEAVTAEYNKLFDLSNAQAAGDLGGSMMQIITAGKEQLGKTYRQGMDEVVSTLKITPISGKGVAQDLQSYLKKFEDVRSVEKLVDGKQKIVKQKAYSLTPETVNLVKDSIKELNRIVSMKGSSLLDIQKQVMNKIDEIGTFGGGVYNKAASQELAEFSRVYRESIANAVKQIDPQAASKLADLNKAYSGGLQELLPPINEGFVKRASKDVYDGIGKLLTSPQQASNAAAMIKSIKTSYDKVLHEVPKGSQEYAGLPFKTSKEAVDNVRASYVKELMPKIGDDLDVADYAKLADKFKNKNMRAKARAVLGEKYVPFMDLLNVMAQASAKPTGTIPSLIVRSKEYAAGGAIAGGLVGVGTGAISSTTAGLGAMAVFGLPEILAKAATDPKYVNRLKGFSKTKFDTAEEMMQKFSVIANDIMAPELLEYQTLGGDLD